MKVSVFYRKNKYMEKKSFLPEKEIIIHDGKIAADYYFRVNFDHLLNKLASFNEAPGQ